jgi:ABC-2 type transport system permease protein
MTVDLAPAPRPLAVPTTDRLGTFRALLARDFRVLRRSLLGFVVRAIMQPLLFIFVFVFVLPNLSFGSVGPAAAPSGAPSYSTILTPGLIASSLLLQGLMAVATPLVMELSYTREIEDRAFAPVPIWVVGFTKIISGTVQAVIAALVVLPAALLIHAKGQRPAIELSRWPLLALVIVLSSGLAAACGLLLGTLIDPRKLNAVFSVVMVPVTMLGCVFYPWAALDDVRWVQLVSLANPLVYISEAMRWALTPGLPHLPVWAMLVALIAGTAGVTYWSLRSFTRRLAS